MASGGAGFRLQTSVSFATASWQDATNAVNYVHGEFEAVLSPSSQRQFYRLVYP